jgi:hypothetical protein
MFAPRNFATVIALSNSETRGKRLYAMTTTETAGPDLREQSKARVFISYSRKDMALANRLEAALKARGFEPLIDRVEIYAFEEWWALRR